MAQKYGNGDQVTTTPEVIQLPSAGLFHFAMFKTSLMDGFRLPL